MDSLAVGTWPIRGGKTTTIVLQELFPERRFKRGGERAKARPHHPVEHGILTLKDMEIARLP